MRSIKVSGFLAKGVSIILTGYLFVVVVVYPLFMTGGGYSSIGNDKYQFFRTVTFALLALVLVLAILMWIVNRKFLRKGFIGSHLSSTQWAAVLFILLTTVSWFFSSYRAVAFRGSQGWFIGLETLVMLVLVFLSIGFFWRYSENIWLCFLVGSGAAFVLGILNRFSVYPIKFEQIATNFISTLGNINWVAGYFSVLWPIGAGLYLFGEKKYLRGVAAVYTMIAMSLGIVQGSESAFLSFAAVFFVLLVISLRRWEKYGGAYLELIIGWCIACQLVRLFRVILPEHFNYATDGIGGVLTFSSHSIYMLLIVFIPYLLMKRKTDFRFVDSIYFKRTVFILPVIAIFFYISLVVVNTIVPNGVLGLAEVPIFNYHDDWGNGRGTIWNLGIELFARMSPADKLIGLGADCFAEYLYSFPDLAALCSERFGSQVLRNAHNEMLTALINYGILGMAAYFSIFITFIVRFMRKGKTNAMLYIPALCVISYLIHNIVSFGQILNLPFVFIVMGIGESAGLKDFS